jgi:pimeloyl-ACP methyl ester carboxylesterase
MPTVAVNGFTMYYEDRGSGEPLLLLHGGMGIGADWRHVFPRDPDGYRVVVPDLRAHGRSTSPDEPFSIRRSADDVLMLLDHLGITRTKAIGLSLGAKALLHVATKEPARLEAMVLVSATPRFPQPLRDAAAQFTRASLEGLTQAERDALRARHVHGDEQIARLYDIMRSFATSHDDMTFTISTLSTITARTLVVQGAHDPYYPTEMAMELVRGIPDATLWMVPDGAHGPIFGTMAAPFASRALAHLSSVPL